MFERISFVFFAGLIQANCYILLQVRNTNNQSDVDALIHKVVPKTIDLDGNARKQFSNYDTDKKYRPTDKKEYVQVEFNDDRNRVHSDNGNFVELKNTILSFFNKFFEETPNFRAKIRGRNIKPETVHFRSGKSSTMYDINAGTIMDTLREMLSSKQFRRYAEKLASKAAIFYRAIKEEMEKDR